MCPTCVRKSVCVTWMSKSERSPSDEAPPTCRERVGEGGPAQASALYAVAVAVAVHAYMSMSMYVFMCPVRAGGGYRLVRYGARVEGSG